MRAGANNLVSCASAHAPMSSAKSGLTNTSHACFVHFIFISSDHVTQPCSSYKVLPSDLQLIHILLSHPYLLLSFSSLLLTFISRHSIT